jgi:hypothetical protein
MSRDADELRNPSRRGLLAGGLAGLGAGRLL